MGDSTTGDLAGHAMGGAGKMGVGMVGRIAVQAMSIIILARLLTPEDYGLVAMVMAIVAVATVLRDFGLTFASVQSKVMPPALRSNLFWVNTLFGVITFVLAFTASWPITWLYGDPRLLALTWAIAPVYLLNALAGQYQADLNRKMKFGKLVITDVGSAATGLVVAVVAALGGLGYWALAIQQLSTAVALIVLLVAYGKWIPRWYDRSVPVRQQVTLGFDIFASQIINYASRNADTVILGIRLDAVSVGLYDRGYQIYNTVVTQINQPSTRVALPVLSRLNEDPVEFKRYIARGQLTLMHPLMLVMAIGVGFGGVLIPFALGSHWTEAALPFQILCVAGLAQAANYVMYWCYLATGTIRENVKLMLVWKPVTILFLIAGSHWGVVGVAVGFAIGNISSWLVQLWWMRRVPITPRRELLMAALRGWAFYFPAGIGAALCVWFGPVGWGIILGVGLFLFWLVGLLVVCAPIRKEVVAVGRTLRGILQGLRRR